MSEKPWHKRYHSDALSGYMELTLEERGAYTTLLDTMYDRREPIMINERLLAGYFGVSIRKMRSLVDALISKGKIYRTEDGRLSNRRFEKELENELKTSRKHSENGSKGGRNRAENEKKSNEINGEDQARLDVGLSHIRSQKPEPESVVSTVAPDIGTDPPPQPAASPPGRDKAELDRIEAALRSAAGLENSTSPGLFVLSPILGLLDGGFSLEEDVLPTLKAKSAKGLRAVSWSYFVAAIRDAREARLSAGSRKAPVEKRRDQAKVEAGFRFSVEDWRRTGVWRLNCPEPGEPGCVVPPEILAEFDIAAKSVQADRRHAA